MRRNLKSDILNVCRGWEAEHIIEVIKEIARENSSSQLRQTFGMEPCPVCGSKDVHITNVMQGVTRGNPIVVAKMGFCTACKFHSKKVYAAELRIPYTEASWTQATVNTWNNTSISSFFEICEKQFGVEYQYACNSEEVFELIESLTRYGKLTARDRRPDRRQDDSSIVSEMADVIICIYQLLHTRHVSPEVLNNVMREKIQRTCQHESVRTAILELSKRITKETHISAHTVADSPQKP